MVEKKVWNWGDILEKFVLILFLFSVTLSIRKVFFVFYPTAETVFNEYTDISLYLSDLLLFVLCITFTLRNKIRILSIAWWRQMLHVKHFKWLVLSPLPFLLWALLSIFWSESEILGSLSFFRLIEGYSLYILTLLYFVPRGTIGSKPLIQKDLFHVEQIEIIYSGVPRGTSVKDENKGGIGCSTWNIGRFCAYTLIFFGVLQASVGLMQFALQSSLGMTFLRESVFLPSQPGVAKVILYENVFIRPYGLFPHPNILAFFLGITLLITIFYPLLSKEKMFHVEQKWIYRGVLGTQIITFLLASSKAAFLGMAIVVIYLCFKMFHVEQSKNMKLNVPRGALIKEQSIGILKMFHVEHWFLLFSFVCLGFMLFASLNHHFTFKQPFNERVFFIQGLHEAISRFPLQGVGIGQWVIGMQNFFPEKLEIWQLQPIHNVFLLILAELGFVGVILFGYFFFRMIYISFQNVPRGTCKYDLLLNLTLIFLITTMLFDHYLWDIQQGLYFFWILMGATAANILFKNIDK